MSICRVQRHHTYSGAQNCPVHKQGGSSALPRSFFEGQQSGQPHELALMTLQERERRASITTNDAEMRTLLNDRSIKVRCGLAINMNLPEDIQRDLAADFSHDVRADVARNRTMPADVLSILSDDESLSVRQMVATNTSAPADVLDGFTFDSDAVIESTALTNASLPRATMERIVAKGRAGQRIPLLRNPSLPGDLVQAMCDSDDDVVAREARDVRELRIFRATGIALDNTKAMAFVQGRRWWEMDETSKEVQVAQRLMRD